MLHKSDLSLCGTASYNKCSCVGKERPGMNLSMVSVEVRLVQVPSYCTYGNVCGVRSMLVYMLVLLTFVTHSELRASPPLERNLSYDPTGPFGSIILTKMHGTARVRYLTFRT
jgi:hypothetical protein